MAIGTMLNDMTDQPTTDERRQSDPAVAAGGGAAALPLAVALPLAALLTAGAAGSGLWLRRRRQRRQQQDTRLKQQQEEGGAEGWLPAPAGGTAGGARGGPGVSLVRLTRRKRLAALLQEQLGPMQRSLAMVSLDALPEGLAHQIGAEAGAAGGPPPSSGRAAGRAGPGGGSIQLAAAQLESSPLLSREQQRSAALARFWDRWQPGDGSWLDRQRGSRRRQERAAPASLQWGLPTESLRVSAASELEVRARLLAGLL